MITPATTCLHVVEHLDRGSVEQWLLRMLRHGRLRGVGLDWTFYCAHGVPGSLDDDARALGARVVHSPVPIGRTTAFVRALRREIGDRRYDALHCHHDLVSAIYLGAALGLPVTKRIVHIHNPDESIPTPSPRKQAILRPVLRRGCLSMADLIVANAEHTLRTFLAGRPPRAGRDLVHYLGIDAAGFAGVGHDRQEFRRELDLAPDALLVLFAGRMVPEKNPLFAVDVLAAMHRANPAVAGIFVGSGSLDAPVRERVAQHGITSAFRSLGWRRDVPAIMGACDWFILPHPEVPMEGFGIAVVEAQLAGLHLLLSTGISDAPLLSGASWRRLALGAGAQAWAAAAAELVRSPAPSPAAAAIALKHSPMDMDFALNDLLRLHA